MFSPISKTDSPYDAGAECDGYAVVRTEPVMGSYQERRSRVLFRISDALSWRLFCTAFTWLVTRSGSIYNFPA